jgi:micrococcal nuclease
MVIKTLNHPPYIALLMHLTFLHQRKNIAPISHITKFLHYSKLMVNFLGVNVYLLVCLLLLCISFSLSAACPKDLAPEYKVGKTVTLQKINDGDTVTVDKGQLIRFIGINTPEINHRDKSRSQPFALQAKQLLEKRLQKGDKLHLVFDKTRHDKYGRLLAYIFTDNGDNLSLLQLQSGLAKHWMIGNNDLFWQCFQIAEQQARLSRKGGWVDFKPLLAAKLSAENTGYQYVGGKISASKITDKGLLLTLDNTLKVNINKRYLGFFTANNNPFLLDQKLLLRGKIKHVKGDFYLSLYHPSQILP